MAGVARRLHAGGPEDVVVGREREELRHLRRDGEGVDAGGEEDDAALHGPGWGGGGQEVGEDILGRGTSSLLEHEQIGRAHV